jgi:hypothetical protein
MGDQIPNTTWAFVSLVGGAASCWHTSARSCRRCANGSCNRQRPANPVGSRSGVGLESRHVHDPPDCAEAF